MPKTDISRSSLILTVILISGGIAALLSPSATYASSSVNVTIVDGASSGGTGFSPANITIVLGVNNTVIWTNHDHTFHSVTSNPGDPAAFSSSVDIGIAPGSTYAHTFTLPGKYLYHCVFHSNMMGEVVVKTASTTTKVVCSPSSAANGSMTTCTASVSGSSPSGNVNWTTGGSGTFSSPACALVKGSCSVGYTPNATSSPVTITGSYVGDTSNKPSSGGFSLTIGTTGSKTVMTCLPTSTMPGSKTAVKCSVKVTPSSGVVTPGGMVTFGQSGAGTVKLSSNSCALSSGGCMVTLTALTAGTAKISATYQGTSAFGGSSSTVNLLIGRAAPTVAIVCTSKSLAVSHHVTCIASLKGFAGKVSGERLSWSRVGGSGRVSFSAVSCALSSTGACSVSVKGTAVGSAVIKVSYTGDHNNQPSSKTLSLTVT